MSDQSDKKPPSYSAFHVKEGPDDKRYFNRIGVAFPHKDGEGHTVMLDATPVDGKIVLRSSADRMDDVRNGNNRSRNRRDRDR